MERKIRIGAVSYLNSKPMLFGLENSVIKDEMDLILDYPANLVKFLKDDLIDIGLVPVAALKYFNKYNIVTDFCIATEGEVASVAVFSQVPMDQIDTVILDYQSRTSVLLCKLLFKNLWKRDVIFLDADNEHYIEDIKGNTAGLIIGDRALLFRSKAKFIYDLGLGWKEMTGLPFVFAVWVSLRKLDDDIVTKIADAIEFGLANIEKVLSMYSSPSYDLQTYLTKNIVFKLTKETRNGMQKFLDQI